MKKFYVSMRIMKNKYITWALCFRNNRHFKNMFNLLLVHMRHIIFNFNYIPFISSILKTQTGKNKNEM